MISPVVVNEQRATTKDKNKPNSNSCCWFLSLPGPTRRNHSPPRLVDIVRPGGNIFIIHQQQQHLKPLRCTCSRLAHTSSNTIIARGDEKSSHKSRNVTNSRFLILFLTILALFFWCLVFLQAYQVTATSSFKRARQVSQVLPLTPELEPAETDMADDSQPNDLVLRAARGESVERTPVWIMRQAGRYLPEFQEVRSRHPFFEVCQTPALACEITLQPLRRYNLDAAIIFSDILVIPQALNIGFEMLPGKGPKSNNPLESPDDLKRLNASVDVHEKLQYVYDAIALTRKELAGKVPLLGFAGGPWTLMAYMIEGGGGSPTLTTPKRWLYEHDAASTELLQLITRVIIDHLIAQIDAGAQMVQVFESSTGVLDAELFARFVAPYLRQIRDAVRAAHPAVPVALFARGALHFALDQLPPLGYDVLSLDWNSIGVEHIVRAYRKAGARTTLQGNLDPVALFAPPSALVASTKIMMQRFDALPSGFGHIANLGHGIYPETPVESVTNFIEVVHEWTKREGGAN